uniref:C-type lectin domain-containing protein n=1 Tax=Panagrolaimus sp. JU765 TaxID=591449 RepID=A0AC34R8Z8_9BILA
MITQAQAEISCIQNGGHLTSIESFPENDFIRELTHIGLITGWQASQFWTGGQRNGSGWYWLDGTYFNYTNWAGSYAYGNPCCTYFSPDIFTNWGHEPGQWDCPACTDTRAAYVCKKSTKTVPTGC